MSDQDRILIKELWFRLTGDVFTHQKLIERIRKDGGIGISKISDDGMLKLIDGRFSGDWGDIVFYFSELLAFYAALGELDKITKIEQVAGWVFASFIIRDAIEMNATDLMLQFNFFMDSFFTMRKKLETEESVNIVLSFFRGSLTPCRGVNT